MENYEADEEVRKISLYTLGHFAQVLIDPKDFPELLAAIMKVRCPSVKHAKITILCADILHFESVIGCRKWPLEVQGCPAGLHASDGVQKLICCDAKGGVGA